jgi:hypothetical protein
MESSIHLQDGKRMSKISIPDRPCRKKPSFVEYELPVGKVLKLFHERLSLEEVTQQARRFQNILSADPTLGANAKVEVVQTLDGRFGQVFAREQGTWLTDAYLANPLAIRRLAYAFATAHRRIHRLRPVEGLPRQRDLLKAKILRAQGLVGKVKHVLLGLLQSMPDGCAVCHGDFEPACVLLGPERTTVSDWQNVAIGNHLCDVARTSLLLTHSGDVAGWQNFLYLRYRRINNLLYLSAYAAECPLDKRQFLAWRLLNAAARLGEDASGKPAIQKLIEGQLPSVLRSYGLPRP